MKLLKEALRRLDELSGIVDKVNYLEEKAKSVVVEMVDQQEAMDADNFDTVTPKEPVFGNWVDVVSKSVKKPREQAPKMHSQQIEVVNTVIYEEREREKGKSNLLILGLSNEG